MALCLASPAALGSDPLDELDGTEGWDQVAPAKQPTPERIEVQDDFRREVSDWEAIRQQWEIEREAFMHARARHKQLAAGMRRSVRSPSVITDENVDQVGREDWGDLPGEHWMQKSGSLDRLIDEEVEESAQAVPPPPTPIVPPEASSPPLPPPPVSPPPVEPLPPPARPTAIAPPDMDSGAGVPSAFKQHAGSTEGTDGSGGLTPGPSAPIEEPPPPPPVASPEDATEAQAKAEARRLKEERKRKEAEEARRKEEEDAGAAAAAQLLKMQAEEARREQEALRKKASLKVDEDGQVLDPELKQEMDKED
ncbi:MAG: hypothetical protein JXR96_29185 [Deltaproteobacteria bacterium]|nr:hypothetical protein [Deltaproteobacteria bacterium]